MHILDMITAISVRYAHIRDNLKSQCRAYYYYKAHSLMFKVLLLSPDHNYGSLNSGTLNSGTLNSGTLTTLMFYAASLTELLFTAPGTG